MMDYPIGISSVGDQDAINCLLAVHFYHDRHMFRHLILQVKQYTQILRADSIKLSLINCFLLELYVGSVNSIAVAVPEDFIKGRVATK